MRPSFQRGRRRKQRRGKRGGGVGWSVCKHCKLCETALDGRLLWCQRAVDSPSGQREEVHEEIWRGRGEGAVIDEEAKISSSEGTEEEERRNHLLLLSTLFLPSLVWPFVIMFAHMLKFYQDAAAGLCSVRLLLPPRFHS